MVAAASQIPQRSPRPNTSSSSSSFLTSAGFGYTVAAAAVVVGWLSSRNRDLVDSLHGVGYWIGIVGASLMAVLLLYPLRKRLRFMRFLGATRHWFRMHMIFGVAGPVLILYHANFRFGSLNSNVAMVCTLVVAVSGLVGRYIYRHIYSDLDGHRLGLKELYAKAQIGKEDQLRLTALVPDLIERMRAFDADVLQPQKSFVASILLPLELAFTTRFMALRLAWYARRQIAEQAERSPIIAEQRKRLQRSTGRFIFRHLAQVRRIAELQSYERLFSLWHVFHLPFFYILVITALIHVLAVHMY
jgi:hypothetical protein